MAGGGGGGGGPRASFLIHVCASVDPEVLRRLDAHQRAHPSFHSLENLLLLRTRQKQFLASQTVLVLVRFFFRFCGREELLIKGRSKQDIEEKKKCVRDEESKYWTYVYRVAWKRVALRGGGIGQIRIATPIVTIIAVGRDEVRRKVV